jgi:hypothetical protein
MYGLVDAQFPPLSLNSLLCTRRSANPCFVGFIDTMKAPRMLLFGLSCAVAANFPAQQKKLGHIKTLRKPKKAKKLNH